MTKKRDDQHEQQQAQRLVAALDWLDPPTQAVSSPSPQEYSEASSQTDIDARTKFPRETDLELEADITFAHLLRHSHAPPRLSSEAQTRIADELFGTLATISENATAQKAKPESRTTAVVSNTTPVPKTAEPEASRGVWQSLTAWFRFAPALTAMGAAAFLLLVGLSPMMWSQQAPSDSPVLTLDPKPRVQEQVRSEGKKSHERGEKTVPPNAPKPPAHAPQQELPRLKQKSRSRTTELDDKLQRRALRQQVKALDASKKPTLPRALRDRKKFQAIVKRARRHSLTSALAAAKAQQGQALIQVKPLPLAVVYRSPWRADQNPLQLTRHPIERLDKVLFYQGSARQDRWLERLSSRHILSR